MAGHPGIMRTWSMIAKDYWWPTMRTFITKYVQGCATCQSTKSGTTKPKVPLVPIPPKQSYAPYSTIALDLITDLPESQGYDSILTITDHDCSKVAFFIPCNKTIDSEGIARCYAKEVFPHYGPPKRVISDRDLRFASKWTRELCRQLGIDQNISTAYHPQTDGQSERTNQWLEQYLRVYGNFQQNDWVSWLPLAQFVHNSWINETTKQTPFDLLMGHTPTVWHTDKEGKMPAVEWHKDYLMEKRNQARQAIQRVQDLLQKQNVRKKGRRTYVPFKEGDQVWLDGKNLKTSHPFAKLTPKRYGPFPVIQVINPVVFKLELPDQWRQKRVHPVFHASLLSPYKETEENGQTFTEPAPDIIEGEEEYEVEQVLDSRRKGRGKGRLEYFLKWEGYPHAHNTWEPADQVHADDLVEEFHKQNPTKARKIIIRRGRMGNGQCSFAPSSKSPTNPLSSSLISVSSSPNARSTSPTPIIANTNTTVGRPSVLPITNSPVTSLPYTWEEIQSANLDLSLPQIF
jgi:Chromo (CHRromatin Organisation MOdifier) domain/Integrase zinc binding domain